MSETVAEAGGLAGASREEVFSALFMDLVMRQANMALMFLGQAPLPQGGERQVDLEAAQMFIDQLEALALKTAGNLSAEEDQLLKQTLVNLRMLFVQVSEAPPTAAKASAGGADAPSGEAPAPPPPSAPAGDESKVRYSKKY